jgi:putative thiamine transport system permease protein
VLEHEYRRGMAAGSRALMLLYAPLIVPQIVFLFSFVVAAEWGGLPPALPLVVIGHLLLVFPYVYLSLAEPYRRLDRRWFLTAQSLGADGNRSFWRIRMPMLLAPILTAAAVGFAVSIGLYLPTLMLGAGRIATLTTEAVALGAGGDRRSVGVWAMLQTLLPVLGFALALVIPRFLWRHRRAMREFG